MKVLTIIRRSWQWSEYPHYPTKQTPKGRGKKCWQEKFITQLIKTIRYVFTSSVGKSWDRGSYKMLEYPWLQKAVYSSCLVQPALRSQDLLCWSQQWHRSNLLTGLPPHQISLSIKQNSFTWEARREHLVCLKIRTAVLILTVIQIAVGSQDLHRYGRQYINKADPGKIDCKGA